MYNTFLFDLDGTLTEPGEGITNSVSFALSKWGIEVEDKSTLYSFIGPPLAESFMKFYNFTKDESLQAVEYYREYYRDKGIYENKVYSGVKETLEQLKQKGKTIILATSKPEEFAIRILKHFNLFEYFDFVGGATMDSSRVKKADVINYIINSIDFDKADAVMVGDREHDVLGAKTMGIDSIGVLYGYGSYEELESAGATHIIKDIKDILSYI